MNCKNILLTPSTISNNYGYDGRLLSYTDARGKVYAFTYDGEGLQTGRQFPDGTATISTYDAVDNLASFTKADGVIQTNSYDVRNRLIQTAWNDGVTAPTNLVYDLAGRTIQVSHGGSIVARAFDATGRQLSETQTVPANATGTGNALTLAVNYSYNADGLLDIMTRPNGSIVQTTYTARNQIDQVLLDGPPPVVDYSYNLRGLMTGKTYESGGLASTTTHDAKGQILSVGNSSNAGVLDQLTYGYNTVGQRTYMQRVDGRGDLYGYDQARQVTSTKLDIDSPSTGGVGVPINDMSYGYDLGGNRSQTVDGGVTIPYVANDVNEYTAVGADAPIYDNNGNLTAGNGLAMTWDAYNRLMSVSPIVPQDGELRAFYQYDGTGRRISKIVDRYDAGTVSWAADEVRTFAYDAWNMIREGVVDTAAGTSETQVKRYTWGVDLSGSTQGAGGVGGLLMVEEDNDPANAVSPITAYYYTNDANGNVTTVTNSAGVAVAQYEYDSYGNVVASVGGYADENPYRFSTKYADEESGWLYYGFRYYMPETGRWASRDPIGEDGGLNLYNFVGNDGVNRWDLLGLSAKVSTRKVGKCEILIVYGHGADWYTHKFDFESTTCSSAAFLGCGQKNSNAKIPKGNQLLNNPGPSGTQKDGQVWERLKKAVKTAKKEAATFCEDKKKCCKKDPGFVTLRIEFAWHNTTWGKIKDSATGFSDYADALGGKSQKLPCGGK